MGINFKPDVTGALAVFSIVPGSPAAFDTQIKCGDLLEQVIVTAVRQPLCVQLRGGSLQGRRRRAVQGAERHRLADVKFL